LFAVPNFNVSIFQHGFDASVIPMFLPLAFVTLAEHIGDHTVLSTICDEDFIKEPGLKDTLLGDGIATMVAGLIGGPANTTYGENTGVVGMTKVGSIYVIGLAAVFAIIMSFLSPIAAFIHSIPNSVMGGISIILFGIIASNGVKIMIENRTDFGDPRNLVIAASMLILGIGGARLQFGENLAITGMALAALVGIILNLVLPRNIEFSDSNLEESMIDKD